MNGYGPFVGASVPTASQIFATLQKAMTSQDVHSLAKQFNATRRAEGYGGLTGKQLDPEENPNFPRRLVLWHGINRTSTGYPLTPAGVFETYTPGNFQVLSFPLETKTNAQLRDSDALAYRGISIYALGFEWISEPLWILGMR